ncbi:MAG: GntR family transcriptional regulator [Elusimicrobia bacterium]|nr:GntR family transcriptional regulator [Elusimicrobiota bacterium]
MIEIDPTSPLPINDQIKGGLKGLVTKGLLRPGDKAPSIRGLAVSLKINPNTVARAFRELALEGFLDSKRGDGNYIARSAPGQAREGLAEAKDRLRDALRQARQGGLSWDDISDVIGAVKGGEDETR